jgi:hypothetical protein
MCRYGDFSMIIGSGDALIVQALTVATIAASILLWFWMFRRSGVGLLQYAVPIALWVLLGTLDIVVTAKGTFGAAANEGNPLARAVFMAAGFFGPPLASVLWISLWSLVVLALKRANGGAGVPRAKFLSLAVFYSLSVGHLFGFSSWLSPLCWVSAGFYSGLPMVLRLPLIAAAGSVLAAAHCALLAVAAGRGGGKGAGPNPSSQV